MPPKVDVKTLAGKLDNAVKLLYELMEEFETILTIDNDILQECVDFYSELYSSRPIHNYNSNL